MLYYEQVFGNASVRREGKCCGVLMKYRWKVKGEQMINLQLAQQLKTKNIKVVPGKLFCRQCKAKFLLETDSVIDTGNEFTECQTPRKKLQLIGISPVSLNAFMEILKSDISEAYKVQVDYLKDSESDYDKNDMKEKVNDLVMLQKAMHGKLKTASCSEQIQVLTSVPHKWSRMYCSVYFNVFENLVWTSHEIKKVGGILAKPSLKKRKIYHHWNTSSGNKRLWRWKFQ